MAPFRVAVLFEKVQLSDITGIDLIGNCSTEYLKICEKFSPAFAALTPHGTDMEFIYPSSSKEPAQTTPRMHIVPTTTYDEAPRDVDVLFVGGPQLENLPEASIRYIGEVCKDPKKKIVISTCIGALWIARAGVLDGLKATTNRGFLDAAKKMSPQVEWLDQRWVVSPKDHITFWTSGGAGAGIDMVATYVKETFHPGVAGMAWDALDFDPTARGQFYKNPAPQYT